MKWSRSGTLNALNKSKIDEKSKTKILKKKKNYNIKGKKVEKKNKNK